LQIRKISENRNALLAKEYSAVELVKKYLHRIDKGVHLNAFVNTRTENALSDARKIDKRIQKGKTGRLAGLILAVKDNLAHKGEILSCASKILQSFKSPYSATVIAKLEKADAIIIGRANMDEFGMGSSNENSFYGPVRNPHDQGRVAGGSSGGSCALVAAGLAMAALGSDTGGSVRQPASFCGVVGLKPTYGRVSRYGLVAYASSFDQIGAITSNVEDAALLLSVISGADDRDSTCSRIAASDYTTDLNRDIAGLKIGLPKEYFSEGLQEAVRKSVLNVVDILQKQGAEIIDVSLPHTEYAIATYQVLSTAEASSNLSRYDGARYGLRAPDVGDIESMYRKSRSMGFGKEVKRRVMLGTYVLSAGYYDAYYQKAQRVRTLIKRDFQQVFEKCDLLITPTAPTTAFKIGEKTDDSLAMCLSDIYTVSANLAGLPAISLPSGLDQNKLPIGVQLIGNYFDEGRILNAANVIEKRLS